MSSTKQQYPSPSVIVVSEQKVAPGQNAAEQVVKDLREARRLRREQRLDEELAQSFPASDPPSWVLGTTPERR